MLNIANMLNISNSDKKDVIILIPARVSSTRLPEKVLKVINGSEMVVRVAKIAQKIEGIEVFVATDSEMVQEVCNKNKIESIIIKEECASGTDRINKALEKIEKLQNKKYKYVLNLQADMPNVSLNVIEKVIENCIKNHDADIETACVEIAEDESNKEISRKLKKNPGTVKAILANPAKENLKIGSSYNAIYFSREPIPYGNNSFYSHLGIYCYKRDSLKKFCHLTTSSLEKVEKLEQLRALENGMKIYATLCQDLPISVDTKKDLAFARKNIF